jgi:hypothetical protein
MDANGCTARILAPGPRIITLLPMFTRIMRTGSRDVTIELNFDSYA